jgi:FXSXX-COOH protein
MQRDHLDPAGGADSELIDVSDLDLSALYELPPNVFGESLLRVLHECQGGPGVYATYDRSMGDGT